MEAELKQDLDVNVTLDRGGGGIFEVWADGDLIYTKASTGRFPQPGEIKKLVKARS